MQDNMLSCTLLGGFFHGSYTLLTTPRYIDQVTTSLLHQLGGYPKEAASKVRSVWQLKVDSGRIFDFSFQVAFKSPLHAAQSRLWFSSRISKSASHGN
jgi:hypothetical protein